MKSNLKSFVISIPDCFVSPYLKLAKGKNGHGERRLYVGNCFNINNYICKKPWKINYSDNYKNLLASILDQQNIFAKECKNRKELFLT